jgi:hypothetical protein
MPVTSVAPLARHPSCMKIKNQEIFREIDKLIDEQMQVLEHELTPEEGLRYVRCSKRIDELLMRINFELIHQPG